MKVLFACLLISTTALARTGDVSYAYEVERQLDFNTERQPQSEDNLNKEDSEQPEVQGQELEQEQ